MERAFVGRPVSEETDDDLAGALHHLGERSAGGDGHRPGHDPIGPEVPLGNVGDVHRAAPAPAVPGVLHQQLRHHQHRIGAVCQRMTVATMRRGDQVTVVERAAHSFGDAFLSDRQVHRPVEQPACEELFEALLESSDRPHGREGFEGSLWCSGVTSWHVRLL